MHFLMQCLQMKPSGGKLEGKPCAYGYYLYVTQPALFFVCVAEVRWAGARQGGRWTLRFLS